MVLSWCSRTSFFILIMQITWHGLSCVKLQTKDATLLVDPYGADTGLTAQRLQADVFVFADTANTQRDAAKKVQGMVIDGPGEYETKGVSIVGIGIEQDAEKGKALHTLYILSGDGITVGLLGALRRPLTSQELDLFPDVDVLFVPVGGTPVLKTEEALEMVSEIEPRIVVPYYFKTAGLKLKLNDAADFLKQIGKPGVTPEEKLRLTRKELPEGDMQVITLKP